MRSNLTPGVANTNPETEPVEVRVLRTLGHGRAALAQLVDAEMPCGRTVRCVEKVFAPGWLTRTIYRISFQSPFAYQSNRDAILSCFYRRRVAAMVLDASDVDASVAMPLYVRFDSTKRAWVLAAQWIDGRGIVPGPVDASRVRRWLGWSTPDTGVRGSHEIDSLVETMHQLEQVFGQCGLIGSGWQVAPRAMVSTANLLRDGDRYTVIDLESGIPAVLVPHYVLAGARRFSLPPFDDLDASQLRGWIAANERLLTFRVGPDALDQLRHDSERLIHHTQRWKDAELALFRRPWRWLTKRGAESYRNECYRRWHQDGIVDRQTADVLPKRPIQARLIWYSRLLPNPIARFVGRLVGRADFRQRVVQWVRDKDSRAEQWQRQLRQAKQRGIAVGRFPESMKLSSANYLLHAGMSASFPVRLHRFFVDRARRREVVVVGFMLLLSARYQSWFGKKRIEASIDRWQHSGRINESTCNLLRDQLSGHEVRAYVRGFGMHVALKALAPIVAPAKVGGVAAFITNGNPWFLLPLLLTPVLRTTVTITNWWSTRHQHVPHGEALLAGCLPVVGGIAFPLQMFAARPELSTFLVRDAAAKLGRRVPIYGGPDSRTELGFIRFTDFVVEWMQCLSMLTRRVFRRSPSVAAPATLLPFRTRTRAGRWIDRQAMEWIARAEQNDAARCDELAEASRARDTSPLIRPRDAA